MRAKSFCGALTSFHIPKGMEKLLPVPGCREGSWDWAWNDGKGKAGRAWRAARNRREFWEILGFGIPGNEFQDPEVSERTG